MRFHYNTKPAETIQFMRDHAIASKAPPAMIDALDDLRDLVELPSELEKAEELASTLENDKADLRDELEQAAESLELAIDTIASIAKSPQDAADMLDDHELAQLQHQLGFARKALERHKT